MSRFELTVWGARGSIPAPAAANTRYGSDTSCVEVRCGDRVLVFDAGTGIVGCGRKLYEEQVGEIDILLTHCHFDHIIGLPFVIPLYKDHAAVRIHAGLDQGVEGVAQIGEFAFRALDFGEFRFVRDDAFEAFGY